MATHRTAGAALFLGGLTYFIANGPLTLALPNPEDWTALFASQAFLARLSVAIVSVFLLLAGALGVFARQKDRVGAFGKLSFVLLFAGSMSTFAHEWGQVFFLHPLAQAAPEGLQALEDIEGANLYDVEAMIALGGFMLGWMLFSASMLFARVFRPLGPGLVLAGLFLTPVLAALLPGFWGFMAGNAVLALGWMAMGRDLFSGRSRA